MSSSQEKQYVERFANVLRQEDELKEDKKTLTEDIKSSGLDANRIKTAAKWSIMDETKRSKILQKEEDVRSARELAE